MNTPTILTPEQIDDIWVEHGLDDEDVYSFSRAIEQAVLQSPEVAAMRKDAERLDWLDTMNAPFKMGWRFGIAPAGNVHPYTVVQLYGAVTTVREAIDAAMQEPKMPDPVAVVDYDTDKGLFVDILDGELKQGDTLITTGQAEAYAQALAAEKVREALEEAAQACEARIGQHSLGMTPEDVEDCDEEARLCAGAVRALIPQ